MTKNSPMATIPTTATAAATRQPVCCPKKGLGPAAYDLLCSLLVQSAIKEIDKTQHLGPIPKVLGRKLAPNRGGSAARGS